MHYVIFVSNLSVLSILWWKLVICQGQFHASLEVSKVMNCNIIGLKWLVDNVSVYYHYPRTYLDLRYHVTEDIKRMNKLFVHVERCNEKGYDCEDFQNYRVDRFCQMLPIKNQAWSEFISRNHPPLRCPLTKAIYEVRNASWDMDDLMNWFPEMTKYLWKSVFKLTNEQNKIVFCSSFDAQLYQFRLQNRKPSRKPSSRPKLDE